jgi:hypothetical protein
VHGKQSVLKRSANLEDLLEDKQDEQDTGCDKQTNAPACIPAPKDSSKVHCHDEA